MYLKKIDGPRAVTLPGGQIITRADLPDPDTKRWVASRKAAVVRAVEAGLIKREAACKLYDISEEEYESWALAVLNHGIAALKTTRIKKYRQL